MKVFFRVLRKFIKWTLISVLLLLVLVNAYILLSGRTYLYKGIACTYLAGQSGPGILDRDYFESRDIRNGEPQPWPLSSQYGKLQLSASQSKALETYRSTSFLVFHRDSLLFEKYWENFDESSVSNSFSMAKSVVSILVGIALEEGKLKSLDQPVSDFIPAYRRDNRARLTFRHLLTMSAALQWNESGSNPLSENAEAYYGSDLEKMVLRTQLDGEPGRTFLYQSGATLIAGYALEKAIGTTLSEYASEKLWSRIGAENKAEWNLDRKDGLEKSYCCIYATSRDFARIGKLYLHQGRWDGKQIVPEAYVTESLQAAPLLTPSGQANTAYGLSWWLTEVQGLSFFYARGILGQYILVCPEKELIIVRTGHKRGEKINSEHPSDVDLYIDIALNLLSQQ